MKLSSQKKEQGIALIMVLIIVAVLITIAGGFAISMKVETTLARNASWDTELEWLGRSGVEIAKWALSQRKGNVDHLGQPWAGGHSIEDANEEVERFIGGWNQPTPGGGEFRIEIEDLDRKLNLNSPAVYNNRSLLENALTVVHADAAVIPTIIGSVKDWIDPDNEETLNGAESGFYEKSDPDFPPYSAKNGMLDDISELLYVKGVRDNPSLYWGSHAAGLRRKPKSARQSAFEDESNQTGLKDLFGAWPPAGGGPGLLNINTASVEAMTALVGMDIAMAERVVQARRGLDGGGEIGPVRPEAVLPPGSPLAASFRMDSSAFEVKVHTRAGKNRRTYVGRLMRRGPRQLQLVDFSVLD